MRAKRAMTRQRSASGEPAPARRLVLKDDGHRPWRRRRRGAAPSSKKGKRRSAPDLSAEGGQVRPTATTIERELAVGDEHGDTKRPQTTSPIIDDDTFAYADEERGSGWLFWPVPSSGSLG